MITHTVQPGENLYSIASRYGVSVQAIMQANGITDPSRIFVGQRLRIPVGGPVPPTFPPTFPPGPGIPGNIEQRLNRLEQAQRRTEAEVERLERRVTRLEQRVSRLEQR